MDSVKTHKTASIGALLEELEAEMARLESLIEEAESHKPQNDRRTAA